jgi:hypothetical protein
MTSLFISYRREDAAGHAGRLSDRLVARFGEERVFIDVEDIKPGDDFEHAIERTLGQCDHLLAVIGPHWLKALNARADDANDLVRREICLAMAKGVRVIPILVGGAQMPRQVDLPPDLRAFGRCDAIRIDDDNFDQDARRLLDFLASTSKPAPGAARQWWRLAPVWATVALILALVGARALGPERETSPSGASRSLPALTYGSWTFRNARDAEGRRWNNSVVQFTSQEESADGLVLRGRFTWRHDNILVGTEDFAGRYIERTRQVIVEGVRVADIPHAGPERLAVGSYSAVLSADERALLEGRWGLSAAGAPGDVGEWEAYR